MAAYEVEIKSLLGSRDRAVALKRALQAKISGLKLAGKHRQLNHYFNNPREFAAIEKAVSPFLPESGKIALKDILSVGQKISFRTRETDGRVLLVIKASVGSDTSANGVTRLEFEEIIRLTLEELDRLLLDSGFTYQAKWSREREEYSSPGLTVCLDRNAGYGYIAEFEKIVGNISETVLAETEMRQLLATLGVEELSQDRLERMFAYYNRHWPEYYGTDRIFVVE